MPLLEYAGGQCPGCDYRENTLVGEAHTIRLHVRAKRHITMTLNDTVESELQRFNYGVGDIGTPYRYFDRRFPDVR